MVGDGYTEWRDEGDNCRVYEMGMNGSICMNQTG